MEYVSIFPESKLPLGYWYFIGIISPEETIA